MLNIRCFITPFHFNHAPLSICFRSTFELASCYNMNPLYRQAFDGTICTESIRSFTLLFLIMFTISLVGMVMIMTRSAMYPFKVILSISSTNEVEDEWEEYQAYLQYMASFINMWGGPTDDDFSPCSKVHALKDSLETSLTHAIGESSTVSSSPTSHVTGDRPSPRDQSGPASFYNPRDLDVTFVDEETIELNLEDEEKKPLSPVESNFGANQYRTIDFNESEQRNKCDDIDDECTPLTPPPNTFIQSSNEMRNRRLPTPDIFQRWRKQDESQKLDVEISRSTMEEFLPETPLMISPTAPKGRDYFAHFISPTAKGNLDGDKFV